ncbi:MAG: envelope stress response membrane protein PspC [Xanthomonadales bacterium]|jgi:phage shock protein C|nr:envelope stress response membrane protein PspC [Xanthomonadales bacterium]MDH3923936.1 envelope stress response membrane protein PspC [Xanthomonadales bacterium]MDH3939657.1 envelope stress response membrane protein PspC [Xanthomonadales bacterium]MDH4001552.1 envelope stress response membrane protein PspC [Xanthomonadales bacterium]
MSDFYKHKNPHRLFRDKENAVLAGVCAGIAEYFGLNRKGVRLVTFLSMLFPPFFAFVVISYVVLTIVLPVKPVDLYESSEQAEFWRGVSNAPSDVFGALRHRFRELNHRLEKMEAFVTSREFEIDQELGRK